jgi:hypothetical protein
MVSENARKNPRFRGLFYLFHMLVLARLSKDRLVAVYSLRYASRPKERDNPLCARRFERELLTGTRSAESIIASRLVLCRIERPDIWQLRPAMCERVDKTFAKPEPSTHGAFETHAYAIDRVKWASNSSR